MTGWFGRGYISFFVFFLKAIEHDMMNELVR